MVPPPVSGSPVSDPLDLAPVPRWDLPQPTITKLHAKRINKIDRIACLPQQIQDEGERVQHRFTVHIARPITASRSVSAAATLLIPQSFNRIKQARPPCR